MLSGRNQKAAGGQLINLSQGGLQVRVQKMDSMRAKRRAYLSLCRERVRCEGSSGNSVVRQAGMLASAL